MKKLVSELGLNEDEASDEWIYDGLGKNDFLHLRLHLAREKSSA